MNNDEIEFVSKVSKVRTDTRLSRSRMLKLLYIFGLLSFCASFFVPATAQKMTSSQGEQVEIWTSPIYTHLNVALGPGLNFFDYCTARKDPTARGDGFESAQANSLRSAFYSLPASCGWFAILVSVVVVPWGWVRPITMAPLRRAQQIAGGLLLVCTPLLAIDFYHDATVYEGYFHLGVGAYLIVVAYLFLGSTLLLQSVNAKSAEPCTPADRGDAAVEL
jgi:hypothetical protein